MFSFFKNYFIAISNYILNFFSFRGKTSRKEFNTVILSLPFIVLILLSLLNTLCLKVPMDQVMRVILVFAIIADGYLATAALISGAICSIFLLSISVRRLKDLGASPWAALLILVPIIQLGLLSVLAMAPSNALCSPSKRKE